MCRGQRRPDSLEREVISYPVISHIGTWAPRHPMTRSLASPSSLPFSTHRLSTDHLLLQ